MGGSDLWTRISPERFTFGPRVQNSLQENLSLLSENRSYETT